MSELAQVGRGDGDRRDPPVRVASVTAKPALSAVSLLASARFLLTGIYQIHGGTAWEHASGWVGLQLTAAAFYLAFALSHLGDHVAAVEREAGVRGQL